jgi:hypothetical protein
LRRNLSLKPGRLAVVLGCLSRPVTYVRDCFAAGKATCPTQNATDLGQGRPPVAQAAECRLETDGVELAIVIRKTGRRNVGNRSIFNAGGFQVRSRGAHPWTIEHDGFDPPVPADDT